MKEVEAFAISVSTMAPSDEPVMVPVAMILFTHHTVNAELAFGEDHENRQESIFKLADGLFRGHIQPRDLALDVFLHDGPDGVRALCSRNNRRLFALLCHQAVRLQDALAEESMLGPSMALHREGRWLSVELCNSQHKSQSVDVE
jgi:hypothetical protein